MKRFFEIIFLTIFTPVLLFSQTSGKNYSIQLNTNTGGILLNPYKISVERNQSKIKILYQRKIKTKNSKKLRKETLGYLKYNKTEDQKKRLIELIEKKTRYKKARIQIKEPEHLAYFRLVDCIFNADWESLTNQIDTKNHIFLDGYPIELKVIKADTLNSLTHIYSGYLKQVPLLSTFIDETFNIYSKNKGKTF